MYRKILVSISIVTVSKGFRTASGLFWKDRLHITVKEFKLVW